MPAKGDKIIVISDVALTARSSLEKPIQMIQAEGAEVEHAFVIVERTDLTLALQKGPVENLKKLGVTLHACVRYSDEQLQGHYESAVAGRRRRPAVRSR